MNYYSNIYKPTAKNLNKCVKLLKEGRLIGIPTETVYGRHYSKYENVGVCTSISPESARFGQPFTKCEKDEVTMKVDREGWRGDVVSCPNPSYCRAVNPAGALRCVRCAAPLIFHEEQSDTYVPGGGVPPTALEAHA